MPIINKQNAEGQTIAAYQPPVDVLWSCDYDTTKVRERRKECGQMIEALSRLQKTDGRELGRDIKPLLRYWQQLDKVCTIVVNYLETDVREPLPIELSDLLDWQFRECCSIFERRD